MASEAQLVDLPPEDEAADRPKIKILTPKIIILALLACYFASQNIYHYMTQPEQATVNRPPPEHQDTSFWELLDRFQSYIIVCIVGLVLFTFLRRANDRKAQQEYLRAKELEEQAEEEEKQKQREREERIIRKIQEQERKDEERQFAMAARQKAQDSLRAQRAEQGSEESKQKSD